MTNTNIFYFIRSRESGYYLRWMRGKIVTLSRPNSNEDYFYYRNL